MNSSYSAFIKQINYNFVVCFNPPPWFGIGPTQPIGSKVKSTDERTEMFWREVTERKDKYLNEVKCNLFRSTITNLKSILIWKKYSKYSSRQLVEELEVDIQTGLQWAVQYITALNTVQCTAMQYSTLQCSDLHCTEVKCSALLYSQLRPGKGPNLTSQTFTAV